MRDLNVSIDDSACSAVIYSSAFAAEVEPALAAARIKPPIRLRVAGEGPNLGDLIAAADTRLDCHPAGSDSECFWLYSSCSTGKPKRAGHRQRDTNRAFQHRQRTEHRQQDRYALKGEVA